MRTWRNWNSTASQKVSGATTLENSLAVFFKRWTHIYHPTQLLRRHWCVTACLRPHKAVSQQQDLASACGLRPPPPLSRQCQNWNLSARTREGLQFHQAPWRLCWLVLSVEWKSLFSHISAARADNEHAHGPQKWPVSSVTRFLPPPRHPQQPITFLLLL